MTIPPAVRFRVSSCAHPSTVSPPEGNERDPNATVRVYLLALVFTRHMSILSAVKNSKLHTHENKQQALAR